MVLAALAAFAPPAGAALELQPPDDDELTIAPAAAQRCATQAQTGDSVVRTTYTAPGAGTITAQLSGSADSDFDLALVDTATGAVRAGSAAYGSTESATTFVGDGQQIDVQVCRRKGPTARVDRRVVFTVDDTATATLSAPAPVMLARVSVRTRAAATRLARLGLDAADGPHGGHWDVHLHRRADARRLTAAGLRYTIVDRDVSATLRRGERADRRRARAAALTPGGRTTYRTLAEVEEELKDLTERHPGLVRPLTLPVTTWDGRQVIGVEIAQNVQLSDGRPVYVQVGTHHANEWPSAEATLEFGLELVKNHLRDPAYLADRAFDERRDRIVREGRTLVIPVLNPDGFDASRQSALYGGTAEHKRKNCRPRVTTPYVPCLARTLVEGDLGVDPNRNYGLEWGGPGSSSLDTSGNHSGPAPWSEPELEGFRRVLRDRQVSVLVTNHTSGRLLMRPPGTTRNGPTPDEATMKPIGDAMGAAAGYVSQYSYNLYNTTGSTSDYTYRGLGVFPYTPEIGTGGSHPSYTTGFVPEYDGRIVSGRKLGGLREAYTIAGLAAIDPRQHAILQGYAPAGRTLRIARGISYITSDRPNDNGFQWPVRQINEQRVSTMTVPDDGQFRWHVAPSRQPLHTARTMWHLMCEDGAGRVLDERDAYVERAGVADLGGFCGAVDPRGSAAPAPAPPGESAPAAIPGPSPAAGCDGPSAAFRFVGARRRGRGVLIRFGRLVPEEVRVTITQLTRGTRRLRPPRVVRRLYRQISFVWGGRTRGGRRVPDGLYRVTFTMVEQDDVRHLTLRKRKGRFSLVSTAPSRTCG